MDGGSGFAGSRHPPSAGPAGRVRRVSRSRWRPRCKQALVARGIRAALLAPGRGVRARGGGRNVVVVTPTASGKTLCYNLPVLQPPDGRSRRARDVSVPDQGAGRGSASASFKAAVDAMGSEIRAFTYDGDTPQDARRAIRERANVVLTNPDMLHTGILPHHTKWAKAFENLRYVVIDELHYYRGVYGSHLANVLRRLKRICEFYGSSPQFICCSATIANPKELAEALTGLPFELVERNGAPSRREIFRVLQSAGGEPSARHPAQLSERDAAHRAGAARPRPADAGVRQQPAGDRNPADVFEGRSSGAEASAAIAAAICPRSGARSSASCATARFAPWSRPTRWSWASTSDRSTPW